MRRFLVAGNWKMNGTHESAVQIVTALIHSGSLPSGIEIVVCPPYVYLADVARLLKENRRVSLGAQNLCAEAIGAFTGEVSGTMLRDCQCRYVIVGHSERRTLYGEDDALVTRKFLAAQKADLIPVLCVGESLDERQRGETQAVVTRQLMCVLQSAGIHAFDQAVIAYEPIWAIGTGKTASPEQAQEVHALIRANLTARDARIGASVRVIYGGSVRASNAAELFQMPDIDGGLVGGASLEVREFSAICKAAV